MLAYSYHTQLGAVSEKRYPDSRVTRGLYSRTTPCDHVELALENLGAHLDVAPAAIELEASGARCGDDAWALQQRIWQRVWLCIWQRKGNGQPNRVPDLAEGRFWPPPPVAGLGPRAPERAPTQKREQPASEYV